MVKPLHPKIKELQLRALPAPTSSFLDKDGNAVDFKIASDPEDMYTIRGYLAVFGIVDDYGTMAMKGCFVKSLQERGPKSLSKYKIVMLWDHDMGDPIGQFTELEEDDYGLRFTCVLDKGVPSADRCAIQVRSGTVNQFSYGFDYVWDKMKFIEEMDAIAMYECALWEGTACTIGANTETYAIRSKQDFDKALELLREETEIIIRTLPRKNQMEVKQLLTKHITLYSNKPGESLEERSRKPALDLSYKPEHEEGWSMSAIKL